MTTEAYKDHRAGSVKGKVHKIFDKDGPEAAIKAAVKAGKQESTARTWCSEWRNASGSKKAKTSKKAAKASARKPVAKKAKTSAKKAKARVRKPAVKRERIAEAASA